MPYTNSVSVTYLHPPEPEVGLTAFLWRLYSTFNPNSPAASLHEDWVEQASVTGVSGGTFSFNLGPALSGPQGGEIALSLQEAGWDGPLFRSGLFETLPAPAPEDPTGGVDIFVPDPIEISEADVREIFLNDSFVRPNTLGVPAAGLPREPTITMMSLMLGPGELTVTATYQAKEISPTDYTRTFVLKPSSEMRFSRGILDTEESRPPSGKEAADASRTIGLGLAGVTMALEARIVSGAIAQLARFMVPAPGSVPQTLPEVTPPPTLPTPAPPIVTVGARRVQITPTAIRVFPALGAFGSVTKKIFPGWPAAASDRRTCPFTQSALLSIAALNLDLLRDFRDELMTSDLGRRCVALYYAHGNEVSQLLDAEPWLAEAVIAGTRELQYSLERQQQPSFSLVQLGTSLLQEVVRHGSPSLRRDVEAVLRNPNRLS
jgi:hypothetical protein